jgi:hypothetical protein
VNIRKFWTRHFLYTWRAYVKLARSIILEGTDGSGKTTLFDVMTKLWGLRSSGHDGGPPQSYHDIQARLAHTSLNNPAVRDRTPCISDIMYSAVLGRETTLSSKAYMEFLKDLDPLIIYCRPPLAVLYANAVKPKPHKPQEFVDRIKSWDTQWRLIQEYDHYMERTAQGLLRVITYNWVVDQAAGKLQQALKNGGYICVD